MLDLLLQESMQKKDMTTTMGRGMGSSPKLTIADASAWGIKLGSWFLVLGTIVAIGAGIWLNFDSIQANVSKVLFWKKIPEFWPKIPEFYRKPEFFGDLSFGPNAQKKACVTR